MIYRFEPNVSKNFDIICSSLHPFKARYTLYIPALCRSWLSECKIIQQESAAASQYAYIFCSYLIIVSMSYDCAGNRLKSMQQTASNMTLAEYSKYWFENIAPNKLASSTVAREKSDIDRFLPHIGHYKLTELRPEHFRKLYVALRKEKNMINGKPLGAPTSIQISIKSSRSLPTKRYCKS